MHFAASASHLFKSSLFSAFPYKYITFY